MTEVRDNKRFYDRISKVYDTLSDSSEQEARSRGLEMLAVESGERVLEIGFGTGHSLVELAHAAGSAGEVHGVDISEGMLEMAGRRVRDEGVADRVELRIGAVPPLPYPDGCFDVVTLSFTLELFGQDLIDEVLAEVRRVLRPEGRLGVVAMSVPPGNERDSLIERAYKWMHRHFPHIVDCRPIDAVQVLEQAGFTIDRQEITTIWTMPVIVLVASVR
ncbi:MAG: methyltransferase domain-containing protein [Acidobacteriota bacterium]